MFSESFGVESFIEESFHMTVTQYDSWLHEHSKRFTTFEIISTTHTVTKEWFGKKIHYLIVTYRTGAPKPSGKTNQQIPNRGEKTVI